MAHLIPYDQRHVAGRMRLPHPPEPGTLLGPNDNREPMVVLGQDGEHTLVGYALTPDVDAAVQRMADGGAPRSLAEHNLAGAARALAERQAAAAATAARQEV